VLDSPSSSLKENDRSPTTNARLSPKRAAAEGSTSASDPSMTPSLPSASRRLSGRRSYLRGERIGARTALLPPDFELAHPSC
jgi:hypothetical protein